MNFSAQAESEPKSVFPPDFAIQTPRLQIIPLNPQNKSHCEFLAYLWNTEQYKRSLGQSKVQDAKSAEEFIRTRVLADYARNKYGIFLVLLRDDLTPIGTVSLMKGAPPNLHYLAPDVGYVILPEMTGRGYATEAAKGLIDYGREELGIEDVFGFCGSENMQSRKVLERIGMDFRGIAELKVFGNALSAIYALPGMKEDLSIYGITEDIQVGEVK